MNREKLLPILTAVVYLAVGALVTALIVTVFSIRDTQTENTPTLEAANRSANLIEDCVKPTGKCFQRGQRRTAKAVGQIVGGVRQVSIDAAACAATEARAPDADALGAAELAARIDRCITELAKLRR